jgi:hypothetical protein
MLLASCIKVFVEASELFALCKTVSSDCIFQWVKKVEVGGC